MIPSLINESPVAINIDENLKNISPFFPFEKTPRLPIIIDLQERQDFIHIYPGESLLFEVEVPSFAQLSNYIDERAEKDTPSLQYKQKTKIEVKVESKTKKNHDNKDFAYLTPLKVPLLDMAEIHKFSEKSIQTITPIFSAIEKTIILVEKQTNLSTIQSITYIKPESKLNGLEIQLEFFDTNPRSINIELIGNAESVKFLSGELKNLELCLKTRFETVEFPKIALSLIPIFPTSFYQQKSTNRVSKKKETEGKVLFKPIKEKLCY